MDDLIRLPMYSKHWRVDVKTMLLRIEKPGPFPMYFCRNLSMGSSEDWVWA